MKVNKSKVDIAISIGNLSVGQTFTTLRTGKKQMAKLDTI